jgi:hypothetical protein
VLEVYEKNVKTTAKNQATNTTNVTIDTSGGHSVFGNGGNGGSVIGGNVSYSDNALQNFGGVYTSAINTAPGGIASALTGVSITINP